VKVLLDEDIIVKPWRKGTQVGVVPKRVGWERLRYDHRINKVVDLMDLDVIYVRYKSGHFELHAVPVKGSQPVSMRYHERHKLELLTLGVDKTINLISDAQYELIQANIASSIADNKQLKARLVNLVDNLTFAEVTTKVDNLFSDHTAGQRQVLKDTLHVLLFLAKKELRK
jgi:hypothetical protein